EGIEITIADMYSIKPIDEELVLSLSEKTGKVIVLEDHLMTGGLASAISDVYTDHCTMPEKFRRMGIPQVYAGFGSGAELQHKYGYDAEALVKAVKEMLA
ncbi:MAG: transketolase family protein, partial [Eubacterium sp.]|nr:transketolase family protein [Eubacterium sp.]